MDKLWTSWNGEPLENRGELANRGENTKIKVNNFIVLVKKLKTMVNHLKIVVNYLKFVVNLLMT